MLEVRSIETTMLEEDGSRAEACYIETGRGAVFAVTHMPAGPAKAPCSCAARSNPSCSRTTGAR